MKRPECFLNLKKHFIMHAIEVNGHIDSSGKLKIESSLSLKEGDVKVFIVYSETEETNDEQQWLKAVSKNPAFDFLKDPQEDIYTLENGKPLNDKK